MSDRILTHDHVDDVKGEDVDGEQGEGHGEQVKVSVVPLAHTVAYPWTVVIKAVCEKDKRSLCKYVNCTNFLRKQTLLESVKNTPVSATVFKSKTALCISFCEPVV